MGRALITSASTRVAYCICKNLSRHGIQAVMADSDPLAMSFWSRHAAGRHVYASPFLDEARFVEDLLRIIDKEKIDVLIPVLEETYFVARHRAVLAPHVRIFMAQYTDLISLHDKRSLKNIAERLGVSMPLTVELEDAMTSGLPSDFHFPAVLKPKQGGGGWSVMEVHDMTALRGMTEQFDVLPERYLVQEKIEGPIAGVAMLYRDGALVAADSYWTVQTYPHPYGQPTVRVSRDFPDATAAMKTILDDLRWTGPCQADFLHDEVRGKSFLIDVNPRFWGSVGQSIARGIDFPYYYYKCAMGENDFSAPLNPPVVATRWLGGDMMRKAHAFLSGSSAARPDAVLAGFAAMDDFELLDPFPLAGWAACQAARKVRSLVGRGAHREALDGVWE
ncbi:ATP-grasp domain-containing protein [Desulfomicrobium baculatum]|uniref:ATP-grasp protein-like protein n=1 Tax=Desulfomicrobium baculatum (strain DSM 4028 / VKM B-1378 / X) TaxID=525897 RepID=C7LPQ3_DESBD|nr:ATP-grasp domain-containing protein [Desulfomicrobium baculatum]ACU90282.1 ATP-grasp protein-like protein [Desulfomicrobium baculatum DSM 4028]